MNNVLWLTASSKEKYSSHLIFQIDKVAFATNIDAGNFVHYLCYEINNPSEEEEIIDNFEKPSKEELKKLIIKNRDKEDIFCDLAVYRKNNNFRLYSSSKFDTIRPMQLSTENEYYFFPSVDDKEIFLTSLVTLLEKTTIRNFLRFEDTYKPKPKKKTKKSKKKTIVEGNSKPGAEEIIVDEYQKILNDSLTEEEEKYILEMCLQMEIQFHWESIYNKKKLKQ
ncbi:DNA-directed primase/polymerase protein-like [Centruroides sculpturatus]|uniref:DNA-directed primase/polymerase protein-like n=1 Tax=Centruroides sculpturatus TaxID=218467 RepID=UPI000C6EB269|nr:DNA-directed primase/polymerase protein-like [Centruroides sculpturatus]